MAKNDLQQALRERAVNLASTHRSRLGRAIARQIQVTVTRYAEIEIEPVAKNCETLLHAVEPLVMKADATQLTAMTRDVIALRSALGFQPSDFIVAAMCFLPVLRRFYAQIEGDPIIAAEMYEEYESVCLPFMGELVSMIADRDLDNTNPDGVATKAIFDQLTELSGQEGGFPRISIITVEDAETDPHRRRPLLPFSTR